MSVDIINDDNFLKLLGDDEEELSPSESLFQMDIPNPSENITTESDPVKTDDDSSVSGNNEVPENTTSGRWSAQEHNMFLNGLKIHGKGWKKIAEMIQTRNVVQVRTHAQKYFQKLERCKQQQLMNSGAGGASGGVVVPVSVSIAENSSFPTIDSVVHAFSSSEASGEYSFVKTTSKRKRKLDKRANQEDNKTSTLKISNKKGRKKEEIKSPKIEFDTASQDETDEETKSETSNTDIALTIPSTAFQPDIYDNYDNSQPHASLKIKLQKTNGKGVTGTPSPISIAEEVPSSQAPVLDDWLNIGNATLNFHTDLVQDADSNSSKINNMNIKQNKCVTGYAIPVVVDPVLANGGFYDSTFDDSVFTQDILEIFDF